MLSFRTSMCDNCRWLAAPYLDFAHPGPAGAGATGLGIDLEDEHMDVELLMGEQFRWCWEIN